MKWFKHDCDMHTNLKVQELIDREGAEGYAIWCLCLELMGKEGKKNKIDSQKRWKKGMLKVLQWSDEGKLERILNTIAEVRLINPKSLKYGNLHIPEFYKRADHWTSKQLRSNFEATSPRIEESRIEENRVDKNRRDDIILHYAKIKDFLFYLKKLEEKTAEEKSLSNDFYKRNIKPADRLVSVSKNQESLEAINWLGNQFSKKRLSWTLETVLKWFPEWLKSGKKSDALKKLEAKLGH